MRQEFRIHRLTFGILAALLAVFVVFLSRLHPSLADLRLEAVASLMIVVFAAAVFIVVGSVEGAIALEFGRQHKRELFSYLFLAALSLGCGLYLALSDSATIQAVALVAAPHALLFGIAELSLSRHLERHPPYRRALVSCGIVEVLLALVLISSAWLSSQATATILSYVAMMSIVQLLPLLLYSIKVPTHVTPQERSSRPR